MPYDTLIKGGQVVIPGQGVKEVDLATKGGRIAAIMERGASIEASTTIDATGLYVLPGALDTHTHWGLRANFGFQCEASSQLAAVGGITTALVMHIMEPGEFSKLKLEGEENSVIDFAFSPTIFNDATADFIEEAIEQWGCTSFKFFMTYRNIAGSHPGDDWNELTDGLMLEAMERLARYDGVVARVHAENSEIINRFMTRAKAEEREGLAGWDEGNPAIAETEAMMRASLFAERAGVPLFFVHLSGRDALKTAEILKDRWPSTYTETCPHYLFHNVNSVPPVVKYSPPVRHREDNEALWEALGTGLLDCVGTDSGARGQWQTKQDDIWEMPRGGPGGVGILLPLVLSEGVNKGRFSIERAVEITSTNAARIFGLYPRKGAIEVGSDADFAIVDMNLEKTVDPELFGSWSDYTLYDGAKIKGWPVYTLVRGQVVAQDGKVQMKPGYGRYVSLEAKRR